MSERAETDARLPPRDGDGGGELVRAILNVLEDSAEERQRLADAQRAVLNVLDDAAGEQARLAETQRPILNILDDVELEKRKVEAANAALEAENEARRRAELDERRARDGAERSNQELEAFSYSVAHDLRAPLRSIDGFAQALLDDYGDRFEGEAKTYFDHIRDSTHRMAQLIDDLLSLARVSRAELKRAPVDLAALARAAIERLRSADRDREAEVVMPERAEACGDARLLDIVFDNLLGNAWKFTRRQPRPRIEFGAQQTVAGTVYFVRDNGAGFDMIYANKLFGVFQRLHSDSQFEGTGIGLVTVHRIVNRHGGRIWAEAAVDRGATFYFTLEGSA